MDALNGLILQAAASPWLLLVMFAVAALDGLFPPIPSEMVLVSSAAVALSSGHVLDLVPLCLAATAGAVLGDNIAYLAGRKVGTERFGWMRAPRVARALDGARRGLDRRGSLFVLTARFIPVGRVAVNVAAGALRYPGRRFVLLTIAAASLWSVYSAGIGALAGHWLRDQPILGAVMGTVLAVGIGLLIDRMTAARSAAGHGSRDETSILHPIEAVTVSGADVPVVSRTEVLASRATTAAAASPEPRGSAAP